MKSGVTPSQILAITFTNKAAKEMRERVEKMATETRMNGVPFVSTFHSLGVHLLRTFGEAIGVSRYFSILDRDEQISIIKRALKELGLDPKEHEPRRIVAKISKEKGNVVSRAEYVARGERGTLARDVIAVWPIYERILARDKSLDFDDLLSKSVALLKLRPDIRSRLHETWKYLHVDEYQDTNAVQYELVRLLTGKEANLCVVGDADQLIYSWRGADSKIIMNFEKDWPTAKRILLEENYRSTATILDAANKIIEKNSNRHEKILRATKPHGEKIKIREARDEMDEARGIAEEIVSLIDGGADPKDIAILFRANFQSRALEEALLTLRIPYQVLGTRFFDRKEVKDLLSYLKSAVNSDDRIALARALVSPTRGIGAVTLDHISSGREEELSEKTKEKLTQFRALLAKIKQKAVEGTVKEALSIALSESGMIESYAKDPMGEERIENLQELINLAAKYDVMRGEDAISTFLADTTLASDQDSLEKNYNAVRLMTVHASKGLEFPYVFVSGLEHDLFPHKAMMSEENGDRDEEERRLFYVAITRAEKKLFLSYASSRMVFGRREFALPSEFVGDIPVELVDFESSSGGGDPFSSSGSYNDEPTIVWDTFKRNRKS